MAYLDSDGLRYLWTKIKSIVPTKTSDITNDSGFITDADIPEGAAASTATPLMDGTAATGSSNAFARGDHVHPSDTSKANVSDLPLFKNEFNVSYPITSFTVDENNDAHVKIMNGESRLATLAKTDYVDAIASVAQTAISGKVDKEAGKGLSTEDYTTAEKTKLAGFGDASTYALKSDLTSMYKYKGSVATVSALPAQNNTVGDVYDVQETGMNFAWNGTSWDALGEVFSITAITNAEIDTITSA